MAGLAEDTVALNAIIVAIQDEGGDKVTDDTEDPGGRTKYGITQRLLSVISPGKTVGELTLEEAKTIYYEQFWLEYRFPELAAIDERIATKVFNFCVNAGPSPAFKCLQRALRCCGAQGVKDDGVLGPITRGRLRMFVDNNDTLAFGLVCALKSEIAGWYRDQDNPRFEGGWVARAYRG